MRMRLRDSKRSIFLDCRLLFLDAADIAPLRAAMQHPCQLRKLVYGSDGVDFDAPVVEIAGVPATAESHRRSLREVAIANTLHASAYDPPLCVICLVR